MLNLLKTKKQLCVCVMLFSRVPALNRMRRKPFVVCQEWGVFHGSCVYESMRVFSFSDFAKLDMYFC